MKEKILERLEREYKEVWEQIDKLDKELQAISRSKTANRFGNALLFGVFPALVIAFILSRVYAAGAIGLGTLTAISSLATVGVSALNLGIFEKKWDLKSERKEYNIPASESEKLEREVELQQQRKRLEVESDIIKSYYKKVSKDEVEFVNQGDSSEEIISDLNDKRNTIDEITNMMFVNDRFCDYRDGSKNTFKSIGWGAIIGMLLSSAIIYIPQLMGGVGITSLAATPITLAATILTGSLFATYAGMNTHNNIKLFKKKNKELGSRELPEGYEPLFLKIRGLLSSAIKDYEETLIKSDSLGLPVEIKIEEVVEEQVEPSLVQTKEEVHTLGKKLN